MDSKSTQVSEDAPHYGKPRRIRRKPVVVTEEEMKQMPPPFPAEPDWVAELDAEADRREGKRTIPK